MNKNLICQTTKNWVNRFVIDLNLCPFAKTEIDNKTVRFEVSTAETEAELLQHLQNELNHLCQNPTVETTLLIHPQLLTSFIAYNDFLALCDELIVDMALDHIYQIASFHPNYQFVDTQLEDAENYTNKSPYPMLHILREHSLDKAIKRHPNIQSIPTKNIDTLNQLGQEACDNRLKKCFSKQP